MKRLWLIEKRTTSRLSQAILAKKAGIAQQTLSSIERGEKGPSVALAKRLAGVLGFDWTLFYPDEKAKEVS